MGFFMPLLFITGLSGTVSALFKRRFEEALPVALLGAGLLLYLSGLFGSLLPGVWAAAGCAALFPALLLLAFLKSKARFRGLLSRLLTPGFCVFLLIYVFVFILDYRRGLGWWDEHSHWGPMAKETFRLDAFYSDPQSALTVHRNYPPIVTLFQYLWCKLCGGYDATYLYRSLHTLSFSLFCPMLRSVEWPREKKNRLWLLGGLALVAAAIVVSCTLVPMEADFITAAYTDGILGVLLAFCFCIILLRPVPGAFDALSLGVGLSFMALTKQIAPYFVALCVCLFLAEALLQRRSPVLVSDEKPCRQSLGRIGISSVLLAAIPAALYLSWRQVLLANGEISASATEALSLAQLPGILLDQSGPLYQRLTVINFKAAAFSRALGTRPLDLSFFQLLFLFVGIFMALAWWADKKAGLPSLSPKRITVFTALSALGGVGYAFVLMLTYVYYFGAYEGPRLASYERYIGTYVLALTAMGVMLLLREFTFRQKENAKKAVLWALLLLCALVVCMPPSQGTSLVPSLQAYSLGRDYLADYTKIAAHTREDASILIVAQGDQGLVGHVIRYEVLPRKVESVSLGAPKFEGDAWTEDLSPEAFAALLKKYDYLYLYQIDEEWVGRYEPVLAAGEGLISKGLYAVVQEEGGSPTLKPVPEEAP